MAATGELTGWTVALIDGGLHAAFHGDRLAYDLKLPSGKVMKASRPHPAGREVFAEGQSVRISWTKGAASLLLV